ncbi:phage tail protein [Pseudomonas sp. 681]|uniref:Phage tail protein n=1 Tax=Pseudomonas fungipugnans TaxID=3024217 RepID=A0ABT6QT80_9PSED|nr:phage tail protein [Pseudomonas sp. 681]MDI2594116.1 phage tail protein [Pseudomonas sp. 681]
MAETFNYCAQIGADGEVEQSTWENDFGDGYTQAGGIGINTKRQTWNMTFTGPLAPGADLKGIWEFLDRHEGYKSFLWTPPGGVQGRYRCTGYKPRPLGASLYTLTFVFKQVFNP